MKRQRYEKRYATVLSEEPVTAEQWFQKYPIWLNEFDKHFPDSTWRLWLARLPTSLQQTAQQERPALEAFITELSKNVHTVVGAAPTLAPAYIGKVPPGMPFQTVYTLSSRSSPAGTPAVLFLTKKEWAKYLVIKEPKR